MSDINNKTFLYVPDNEAGDLYLDLDTGHTLSAFVYEYETDESNPDDPIHKLVAEDIIIGFKASHKDAELVILKSDFVAMDEANRALKIDVIRHLEDHGAVVVEVPTSHEDGDNDGDENEDNDGDNDGDDNNDVVPFK